MLVTEFSKWPFQFRKSVTSSADDGLIGYSDPKFEFYSPLNEENQQKIHDYIDSQGLSDPNE